MEEWPLFLRSDCETVMFVAENTKTIKKERSSHYIEYLRFVDMKIGDLKVSLSIHFKKYCNIYSCFSFIY